MFMLFSFAWMLDRAGGDGWVWKGEVIDSRVKLKLLEW
jgi:hypothetical protein